VKFAGRYFTNPTGPEVTTSPEGVTIRFDDQRNPEQWATVTLTLADVCGLMRDIAAEKARARAAAEDDPDDDDSDLDDDRTPLAPAPTSERAG
jgi:hypothetical protein